MVKSGLTVGWSLLVVFTLALVARADGVKIGDAAPGFNAETVDGKALTLADAKGSKVVVVTFMSYTCPVAVAYHQRFVEFVDQYKDKGVAFLALNVNVNEDLKGMKAQAEENGFNFPYAYDASGKSSKAYGAQVTPHVFVIDGDGKVAYIGAFDDNMSSSKVKHKYVADAVDALLAGKRPEVAETKAFGCNVKR